MLDKIAHIGIAVFDIEKSLMLYRDILGMKVVDRMKVEDMGLEVLFLDSGNTYLELLQPLNENNTIYKFLQKKGEGIHHISYEVDDIETALQTLADSGIELIDKKPRIGAWGEPIAFLHPKSTGGVLIELEQKKNK